MNNAIVPRCLPIRAAADYMGISESLFRAIVRPVITPVYMSPRRPVWLREDLDKYINERAGISTAATEDDLMDAITNNTH